MQITVYNPQKGRLETIDVESLRVIFPEACFVPCCFGYPVAYCGVVHYNKNNTTWFCRYRKNDDIYRITDYQGKILIKDFGNTSPLWIYSISRADIGYSQKKAKLLMREYE